MTCLYVHPRECCVMVIIFIRGSTKAGTRFQTKLSCLIPRSKMEWNRAQRCVHVCVWVPLLISSFQVSMESGHVVEWTREDNFMFRLTSFRDRLLEWVETKPYRKYICSFKYLNFILRFPTSNFRCNFIWNVSSNCSRIVTATCASLVAQWIKLWPISVTSPFQAPVGHPSSQRQLTNGIAKYTFPLN